MKQQSRQRMVGMFGANGGEMQRRVASSDTRNMHNSKPSYEQSFGQRRAGAKATSQTRGPAKELNRSIGFQGHQNMQKMHQQSALLNNAADLLTVGSEQRQERDVGRYTGQGRSQDRKFSQGRPQVLSQAGEAYQSSLLSRYIRHPTLPPSKSIHSALSNERQNGWPTLNPVRQAAAAGPQRNSAAASGIPRPTINKFKNTKTKTTRNPSQDGLRAQRKAPSSNTKYAFKTPINYQNEHEIMRKIFGNARTTSGDAFAQLNANIYQKRSTNIYDFEPRKSQNNATFKASSPTKVGKVTHNVYQDNREQPIQTKSKKPPLVQNPYSRHAPPSSNLQHSILNSSTTADRTFSPSPPRKNFPHQLRQNDQLQVLEYSEPRNGDQRTNKTLLSLDPNKSSAKNTSGHLSPVQIEEDQAQDSAERAFFELQDAKVNFFQEKTEYEDKKEKRRQNQTFTNGFLKSSDPDRTVTSTFESSTAGAYNPQGYASRSNGFAPFGSNPNHTSSAGGNRFGDAPLIGDDKGLKSDAVELSKEELKERLFVAEKVMKTLFKRNKELEEMHFDPSTIPDRNLSSRKSNNIDDSNSDALRARIKDLERQLEQAMSAHSKHASEPQSYKDFMTMRLEQSQAEAKRHFENYVNVRDQLNQQLDKQAQQNTPTKESNNQSQYVTPKSNFSAKGGGSNKLRQDVGARAQEAILQEQELVLQREADNYKKGLDEIEKKLLIQDQRAAKLDTKVKQLEEEIDRRRFLEAKVQTYVRSLIDQNEKCKNFIRATPSTAQADGDLAQKAQIFLQKLDASQYDEHEGQSTENEEEEVEESEEETNEHGDEDVAISDI